jgi:tripartite-type tricarboxylate transporter receptor subunit TctC
VTAALVGCPCKFSVAGIVGLVVGLFVLCDSSNAQVYPNRPIRIVVPAAAGGALDLIGRVVAQGLSQQLKQKIYVENRAGANMMIGTEFVAKSEPDGYTLLCVSNSALTVSPFLFGKSQFDPLRELVPIAVTTHQPYVLVANKAVPGDSLAGLVSYMRKNPEKLNHASNSVSTMLVSELFKSIAKVDYVDVNFRGAANALVATQSGTTQFAFVDLGSGTMALQSNELRALGVTTADRYGPNPKIPTFVEQGFAGLVVISTSVLMVPKDTSRDIVETIKLATSRTLKSPETVARFHAIGLDAGQQSGDEAYQALMEAKQGWEKLIKERNIRFH